MASSTPKLTRRLYNQNEISICYFTTKVYKNRPSLVMVHGFRGDHRGMLKIAAELGDSYNLFIPDLPGFGASQPFTSHRHDVQAYANFLHDFIKKLELKKPNILAHSFGTTIASAFATEHPEAINKLVLLSPIAANPVPKALNFLTQPAMSLLHALPEKLGRALTATNLVTDIMSLSTTKTKDKQLRRWIKVEHRRYFNSFATHRSMMEAMQASSSHHVAMYAKQVTTPTLIIAGDKDGVGKFKHQKNLAKLSTSAQLKVISGVGHLTHYETPKEVAAATKEFLD
ncbi:MAG: alpha/beta hydrolase [Candidatus Nomurabacteria bacterium]|jgi:pimeloyl-ACP methyl ester carboxylesterase|nr:alpha/beta hydrolase [Candidatus Nomurabacteria bacterium]